MNSVSESVDAGATWASSATGTTTSTSRASSSARSAVSSSSSRSWSTASASSADSSIAPRSSASSMKVWTGAGKVVVLSFVTPLGLGRAAGALLAPHSFKRFAGGRYSPPGHVRNGRYGPGRAPHRRPLRSPLYRSPDRGSARSDPAFDAESGRIGPRPRRRGRFQAVELDDAADDHRGGRRLNRRPQAGGQVGGPARDSPARGAQRRDARD